jgi:CheY-like chemotaxis protein
VQSELGQGSVFWFTLRLPLAQSEPTVTLTHAEKLVGKRVLIVDDNATNRTILHHQILGWRMRNGGLANGGPDALRLLREGLHKGNPYQLALLDMDMPEMNGLQLAQAIRTDAALAGTRLVVLTSLCDRMKHEELRQAGVAACLVKPVRQTQLFGTLLKVFSDANSPAPAPADPEAGKAATPTPAQTARILLAEDNVVNQKVALRQLQLLGYRADCVANGQEVLEALGRTPYGLILMDCHMPELDGFETTRRIRELENGRHRVKIVAMTASAMNGDRERCLGIGMNDYITKPTRLADLEGAVNRALADLAATAATARVPAGGFAPPKGLHRTRFPGNCAVSCRVFTYRSGHGRQHRWRPSWPSSPRAADRRRRQRTPWPRNRSPCAPASWKAARWIAPSPFWARCCRWTRPRSASRSPAGSTCFRWTSAAR